MAGAAPDSFIGRRHELEELSDTLQVVVGGEDRVCLISGEPGIGKTRLSEELVEIARRQGVAVAWGRCSERTTASSFWPWAQAADLLVREADQDSLLTELGTAAGLLAEIVPSLRKFVVDLPIDRPTADPVATPFRLADAIVALLRHTAESKSLLVVIDDLQWADSSSLLLLEYLVQVAGRSSIFVVGTYRSTEVVRGHALFNTISAIGRSSSVTRIQLTGLPGDDTQRLFTMITGGAGDSRMISDIYERTSGNPLFAAELARHAVSKSANSRTTGSLPIGIHEAIGARLDGLTNDCNRVLTTAAVVGVDFSLNRLRMILGDVSESDLLSSLEEGVVAQLISEVDTETGRAGEFRFTHALVQEVISTQTSDARSASLHATLANKLEDVYGDDAQPHAAELEYHFRLGRSVPGNAGTEKALHYGLAAGFSALEGFEYEQAAEYFQRGIAVTAEPGVQGNRGEFFRGMAEASNPFGDPSAVVEYLNLAFGAFVQAGDSAGAIKAAATGIFRIARQAPEQVELVRRGLELVQRGSRDAALVLNEYGVALGVGALQAEEGIAALEEALAIARTVEDGVLETHILHNLGFVHITAGEYQKAVDRSLELLERSALLDVAILDANAHRTAGAAFAALGESAEAQRHIGESLRLSSRFQVFGGRIAEFDYRLACWLSLALGQWDRALELNAEIMAKSSAADGFGVVESVAAMIGDERIALVAAKQRLEEASDDGLFNTSVSAESAMLIAELGRRLGDADAVALANDVSLGILNNDRHTGFATEIANFTLATAAAATGDSEVATVQYAVLRDYAGLLPMWARSSCPDRLLALLSVAMDEIEQAISHFEDALNTCEQAGYGPELAWSCFEFAQTLLNRGFREDRDRIIELVRRGFSGATRLGMHSLEERLSLVLTQAEAIPTEPEPIPAGLTQREVEVLRLVALGRSNADIADELVITHNTVITHVRHILEKTESVNRAEAGAFAHRFGLAE